MSSGWSGQDGLHRNLRQRKERDVRGERLGLAGGRSVNHRRKFRRRGDLRRGRLVRIDRRVAPYRRRRIRRTGSFIAIDFAGRGCLFGRHRRLARFVSSDGSLGRQAFVRAPALGRAAALRGARVLPVGACELVPKGLCVVRFERTLVRRPFRGWRRGCRHGNAERGREIRHRYSGPRNAGGRIRRK